MHVSKESGRRMCWHCEGYVAVHLAQCPYCQAFLQDPTFGNAFTRGIREETDSFSENRTGPFNMPLSSSPWEDSLLRHENSAETSPVSSSFLSKEAISLTLLFFGIGLGIFGLFIAFFGQGDKLVLTWSRSKAFYYVLAGVPLIYKGCKSSANNFKKKDPPEELL